MLRTVRAFLWMRWRVSRNAFKSRQRDSLEQISRALAALAPAFLILMFVPTVIALAVGAGFLGFQMGRSGSVMIYNSWAYLFLRIGLGIQTIVVLIAPMVRSARGTGSETTRLMLLPIRRRMLHASEVIGALSDPWLGVLFPALLVFPLAIIVGGETAGGVVTMIGGLLFVSIIMLAVSLASFLIGLVFRRRKRAEWFTIVVITLLSVSGITFGLWAEHTDGRINIGTKSDIQGDAEKKPGRMPSEHFDNAVPSATRAAPSEMFLRLAKAGVDGAWTEVALWFLGLASWATVLYGSSRWAYSRLLETPESGGSARKTEVSEWRVRTLPWVSPVVSAVAMATMRLALRTVRGKTGVYLNFIVLGLLYFMLGRNRSEIDLPPDVGLGMGIGLLGAFFTLLSLQPILINIFAIDANGLTLQFLSPVGVGELLRGKLIGAALLSGLSTLLCFVAGLILDPSGSPLLWLSAVSMSGSLFLLFGPTGLILSAIFPKVADLSRMGKEGNPQPIAAFIATFAVPLFVAPPVVLVALSVLANRPAVALLLSTVWLLVSAAASMLILRSAMRLFERRRENLLLVATGR